MCSHEPTNSLVGSECFVLGIGALTLALQRHFWSSERGLQAASSQAPPTSW